MSPSAALQARIRQFESLGDSRTSKSNSSSTERAAYPPYQSSANGSTSMLDSSPTPSSYTIIKPVPYVPRKPRGKSPSPSPPNLGCKTSLIDLKDWVVEDSPNNMFRSSQSSVNLASNAIVAPPLPPRKSSQSSTTSGSLSSRSRSPYNSAPHATQPKSSPNSLTVDHTYPPLSKISSLSTARQAQGHMHASSTSSFHSVSLSSDGGNEAASPASNLVLSNLTEKGRNAGDSLDKDRDRDMDSVDDSFSFETVSSTGVSSPTLSSTHEWEKDFSQSIKPEPPKLPSRKAAVAKSPSVKTTSPSLPSSPRPSVSSLSSARRIPPPPPQSRSNKPPSSRSSLVSTTSASDRSSIFSTATITTAHTSIGSYTQLLRPTPIPHVARMRYEALFFANVNAQKRGSTSKLLPSGTSRSSSSPSPTSPATPRKGWRGLSVDLITNPEDHPLIPVEDNAESSRLEGAIVKVIWSKSSIQSEKLRDIWNDCALPGQTSLDKDGFVKGMWQIDEELRRQQSSRNSSLIGRTQPSRRTTIDSLLC